MVGSMDAISRERVASLINSVKFSMDIPSKLQPLRQLKDELLESDYAFLSEFLSPLLHLHTDRFSPVRKFVTEIIGDIGLKHVEFLPEILPVLVIVLKDGTPAVARQAITCGIDIFRCTLVKVAIQGLYSSDLDDSLESSWEWVLKFRDEIYSIAFQPTSDGRRLLALKFIEAIILLYTPDPCGSSEPPSHQASEGLSMEFNISWLRGGHPVLNVGDLSIEASQNLGLLLDQLRFPVVKSLSSSMIIVLINSLSAIATKRPAFYGRILPVLLGLDYSSYVSKGVHVSGPYHALKNAFLSCLKCTHLGAVPWRDRLVGALREMKAEGLAEVALSQVCQINGSVEGKDISLISEIGSVRKRAGGQDISDLIEDKDVTGKRVRTTPIVSEGSTQEFSRDQDGITSSGPTTSREVEDNGPVQQLVAMFGALVAQGEKAIGSLEILISSISSDLLAEVVMANMRHFPLNRPKAEGDEEPQLNQGCSPNIVGSDSQFKYVSSFLTDMFAPSRGFPPMDSVLDAQQSAFSDIENPQEEEEHPVVSLAGTDVVSAGINHGTEKATTGVPVSSQDVPSVIENSYSAIPSEVLDDGNLASEIPGLDSATRSDGLPETLVASSFASTDEEDASQEQVTNIGRSSLELLPSVSTELLPSVSTDRSEELSSKAAVTDANSINSSTATSVGLSTQFVLPKMSAPVINLDDEQKDNLQLFAFNRIIEAYKQIAVSGGSNVRSSTLAYLGVEFPLELDPWKLLQKHILSDYVSHEGHELTLRVLYRLFGEAEERDFFSSRTATSVYEMFLLTVAETLRDSFPASDKSLSRLLSEVPYLPKSILKLLECLCCPGNSDKDEKELHSGDRVTQGLSMVWSLILLRPSIRNVCLKIALQSAVHHLEEVRMKAIRLVANKLYPLSSITEQIEDFAKEMLHSVINSDHSLNRTDTDGSSTELQKDPDLEKPSNENPSVSAIAKDISADTHPPSTSESISSSLSEAQRCMSLYFALCTKKHTLFRQIFLIYKSTSNSVKQAVHGQIPILVRTIGTSSELLGIISDPPTGSENLLMQVLQTLTDGTIPSAELIFTIRKLYDTKLKDVEILIPILSFLPKDEILLIFPHLVNLPSDKFQAALTRALQGSTHSGPVLTPTEVLIAIHGIDPDRDGIPLKKVTDACNACFEQRQIFTQQVLAKVLNQLVEQIPLPLLFMRTVLQAIGAFPALVDFIMEILSRLVSKQIWKYPKLWVGFLKCVLLTKPQSFSVLLQLPPAQLENALNRTAALKAPLIAHANQPNIRSSLPRSVLVVLGIVLDSQSSSQAQATQTQTQTSQTQTQTTQTHTQTQTGDTGNSDKEAATKESSTAS
ncbi:uncharacterized protein LOC132313299 isoform X2 [Cornus florida]|uniref:uncharacterized protein LOC132313299 isoform X2 n=1 Tax=Cornus florida TaxID=4283 RepID=UPI00289A463F|nr:uncharacterized protein LOC132313299 isoform X2 [Cornus florida]